MEKPENSHSRNALTTIAVIGLIVVSIFGIYKAANSWNNVNLSDQTPAIHDPIRIDGISFKVYADSDTPGVMGSLIDSVSPGGVFNGGFKYPDISVSSSQPFFVDSSGDPTNGPIMQTYNVCINGTNYVATKTDYGIDILSRTHVDLGQVIAGETTKFSAEISPWKCYSWRETGGIYGFNDVLIPDGHSSNGAHNQPDYYSVEGSLVFTCDAGLNLGNSFGYTWGADHPSPAFITQSLSPFFHEWADAKNDPGAGVYGSNLNSEDLDRNFFHGAAYGTSQQKQLDYVMNHYKIQPVYVVPSVQIEAQSAPVWQSYSRTTTLSNGTKVNIAVNYTGCISGFRNAYVSNITQYEQTGQITKNLYQAVKNNATVLSGLTGTNGTTSSSSGNNPGNDKTIAGTGVKYNSAEITGSLIYKGPETLENGSKYEPAVAGSAWMAQNIAGLPAGDYHFDVKNLSAISNMPTKATLSTTFHLQPAATISWADMEMITDYFIWNGNSWQSFTDHLGPQSTHIYYPFAISANNMYCIERAVVETWTLSRYSLTMTSNGSPISGKLLTDDELTNITNNPWIDNNVQTVPIPTSTDWLTVVIWIVVVIIAVIIIISIINRNKGRVTVEVKMEKERGYRG